MPTPSRSEVFAQISDLTSQLISATAMMAHLHNTEGNDKDKKLAIGWLMMAELFKGIKHKVILLGQGRLN